MSGVAQALSPDGLMWGVLVFSFLIATLLPGKSHGWRSLVGCSPLGLEELDMTEQLHFHFSLSCIGEEMATHSSVLALRIPGTGEPGGLPSMGRTESDMTEAT